MAVVDVNVLHTHKVSQSLRRRYVLALSIIALLVILSQVLIQFTLTDQEGDSRVVNVAGRQRMLSQRITKCVLLLESSIPDVEREFYLEELRQSVSLWRQSHAGLQRGDGDLGLPGKNSPQVTAMFVRIEPHFHAMVQAVGVLSAEGTQPSLRKEALASLLSNQAEFLSGMDAIVFQYDAEAKQKITVTKRMEAGILIVTFMTIVLEVLFIFLPAEKHLKKTFEEYRLSEAGLKSLFDMTPTPMIMVELDNLKLVRVNQAASNLLNIPEEEMTQKFLIDFLDAEQKEDVAWKHVLSRQCVAGIELPIGQMMMMAFATRIMHDGKPHLLLGLVDITAKYNQNKYLAQLAATDSMTGLMNRRAFLENLELALQKVREEQNQLSIAFLDLDGLKKVNDTYGHQEGDWYIGTIASLIRTAIREDDIAGRLGGDEFAIIFPQCPPHKAKDVLSRIHKQLESLALSLKKPYFMGCSFGVVSVDKGEKIVAETLLHEVDKAMYKQKHQRRWEQMRKEVQG